MNSIMMLGKHGGLIGLPAICSLGLVPPACALVAACSSAAPPTAAPIEATPAPPPSPPSPAAPAPAGETAPSELPPEAAWTADYLASAQTIRMTEGTRHYRLEDGALEWDAQGLVTLRWGPSGTLVRTEVPVTMPLTSGEYADGILLRRDGDTISALDVHTGQEGWQATITLPWAVVVSAARAGEVVVADLKDSSTDAPHQLVAFDVRTGQQRWSRSAADRGRTIRYLIGTPSQLLLLEYDGTVTSVSPEDGSVRWSDTEVSALREDYRDVVDMALDDTVLLLSSSHRAVRILDAATGEERHRMPVTGGMHAVAAAGGTGYVLLRDAQTEQLSVAAIDLDSGTWRWRTALDAVDWRGDGHLAVGAQTLYGCGGYGRLFAIERQTGTPLWRSDIGRCDPLFAPLVLPPAGSHEESLLVQAEEDPELMVFERGTGPLQPPEQATVHGQVTLIGAPACAGIEVVVGGAMQATDSRGRYRIDVQGLGTLPVHPRGGPACFSNHHCQVAHLRLEGRRTYEVDFRCEQPQW
ncbi:MAG: PQQ-like beta-propeller repeat protein [Deltaproteobacteria bacterium]|nr:PQQ-like beta-propeller repeat protein [Deltaproteobacteria bacterium]